LLSFRFNSSRTTGYIVGFREPHNFHFPKLGALSPKVADILEPEVDNKYTLTDNLWKYLQEYARKHKEKGNGFGFGLADLNGTARTLSARYYKDGAEILIPQLNKNPRRLTPRECARLMGFPDDFQIVCSDTRAYKQFGNSVAVPVVTAIAKEVVACLKKGRTELLETQLIAHQIPLMPF
jgi:DNA (cytosine-5)-methyltransferase 1